MPSTSLDTREIWKEKGACSHGALFKFPFLSSSLSDIGIEVTPTQGFCPVLCFCSSEEAGKRRGQAADPLKPFIAWASEATDSYSL